MDVQRCIYCQKMVNMQDIMKGMSNGIEHGKKRRVTSSSEVVAKKRLNDGRVGVDVRVEVWSKGNGDQKE